MSLFLNFIIGFLASLLGVIPPGLLNMSAAKISMTESRKNGLLFSVGVSITVMLQTYIALLLARYLDMNPEIIDMLKKVALGIFICITIYFFFIAKDTRREISQEINKSKTNRFFTGIILALLNLLPLPYWVYISITFSGFGWFKFTQPELWIAVVASGLGTFAMLAIYVQFFRRKEERKGAKINMNYVIGLITALISVITAYKIFKDVF
jgi:threonine/homoserine/homoserine lactone efflux protein